MIAPLCSMYLWFVLLVLQTVIGGWSNTDSVIREKREGEVKDKEYFPGILRNDQFRGFWVQYLGDKLSVGKENEVLQQSGCKKNAYKVYKLLHLVQKGKIENYFFFHEMGFQIFDLLLFKSIVQSSTARTLTNIEINNYITMNQAKYYQQEKIILEMTLEF